MEEKFPNPKSIVCHPELPLSFTDDAFTLPVNLFSIKVTGMLIIVIEYSKDSFMLD